MKKSLAALMLLTVLLCGCQQRAEILVSYETQPTTEMTMAPTTVPETEAPTVPTTAPTEPTTVPTELPTAPETEPPKTGRDYVLNTNTDKFHYPDCGSVKQIKASNRQDFTGSREELLKRGFDPCKRCNP